MNQSENVNELISALLKAQAQFKIAKKNAKNPYFNSEYAELGEIVNAVQKPLAQEGIAIIQTVEKTEAGAVLVSTLVHTSGQWIKSVYPLLLTKQDSQAMGSAITYARRYSLQSMLGICPMDDDAEAAMPLSEKAQEALKEALGQDEKTKNLWRQKFNVYDLNTISRSQYTEIMKFLNARNQRKETNGVNKLARMAQ